MSDQRPALPAALARLRLNGCAADPVFAQNPLPVLASMGHALAEFHDRSVPDLPARTEMEVAAAIRAVTSGAPIPRPFDRSKPETIVRILEQGPPAELRSVSTHGAPIVANAMIVDSVTRFVDTGTDGLDPAERDLAIVLRSIADTFSPEATRTFMDAYENAGGRLPDGPTLDWYGLVAAFR